MKEAIKKFFQIKQAKIGLAVVCIAAVLVTVFLLQPATNRSTPVADTSITSAAPSLESIEASTVLPEGSQIESSGTSSDVSNNNSSSDNTSSVSTDTPPATPSADSPASSSSGTITPSQQPSSSQEQTSSASSGMEIDPETGKDKYQTDPVPEGKPTPIEPEDATVDENTQLTCTLSIRCDTILNNMDMLKEEKKALVPSDGIILAPITVTFSKGESVFDVLKRVTREQRIHMEFEMTPIYNSAYIEGIHNLYEFDCGNLSGWMYKVNDWFPNYGCSRYQLRQGDVIEWVYTCDLGNDVGGGYATGQGESE